MVDEPTPQDQPTPPPPATTAVRDRPRFYWPGGLSARLLTLTILFVTLGAALALPPAMAAFERQWLLDRVRAAELASLAPDVAPDRVVTEQLSAQLLRGAGVEWVAIQTDGMRRLVLRGPTPPRTPYLVDLRSQAVMPWLAAPFRTIFGGDDRRVRVVAAPSLREAEFIEIVAPDAGLKAALLTYLGRLVLVIAFVAAVAGVLVYLSLNLFLVRPMQRITHAMERFRANPDDPAARVDLSGRQDEIGRAEAELERMQADLRAALNSRARLAALGEAVAKINHDLRNMLTAAQIASERLSQLDDPKVRQAMPRLERALDRAVKLATDVLTYGKTEEQAPQVRSVKLAAALVDAAEEARLSPEGVRLVSKVGRADKVDADPEQLHRMLANLLRNARQAIEAQTPREEPGCIEVSLTHDGQASIIRVADNGPGVPERSLARLFQPFAGSTRPGGAGLGLAIARELAAGHGGDLTLAETGPGGAAFELRLPDSART